MIKIEQRKETRVAGSNLPKKYQTFIVTLDNGEQSIVRCIDASLHGFSFFSDLTAGSFVAGTKIHLYLDGIDHPIDGLIVSSDETKNGVRKGVSLLASEGYEEYQTVFHIIVSNLVIEKKKSEKKRGSSQK